MKKTTLKRWLLLCSMFMLPLVIFAQIQNEEQTPVFDVVEEMPAFDGAQIKVTDAATGEIKTIEIKKGDAGLMQYLSNTIKYPIVAEENGIQGRVICTFVVERDGTISDVKVTKSVDPSLDKEAVRVLKSMPKWKPGKQKGENVRVKYTVPVTFRLQ